MRLEEEGNARKPLLIAFFAVIAVAVVALGAVATMMLPKAREAEEVVVAEDEDAGNAEDDEAEGGGESLWSDENKRVMKEWQTSGTEYFDPYGCAAISDIELPDGLSKYLMQESIASWAREGHVAPLDGVTLQQSFEPNGDNPEAANEYGWSFVGTSTESGQTVAFTVIYNPISQNFETYSQH